MRRRPLTDGEQQMLTAMYGVGINYGEARIHAHNFWWPIPQGRIMAPNGDIFFPRRKHHADFSNQSVPTDERATFVHEGAHLYQYYLLGWNVMGRRLGGDGDYEYALEPGKRFQEYGMEQQGEIAYDYYMLQNGLQVAGRLETLADYAAVLPPRR